MYSTPLPILQDVHSNLQIVPADGQRVLSLTITNQPRKYSSFVPFDHLSGTVLNSFAFPGSTPFSVTMDITAEANRVWSAGLPLSLKWGIPVSSCQGLMEIYTIYAAGIGVGATSSQIPSISITYGNSYII